MTSEWDVTYVLWGPLIGNVTHALSPTPHELAVCHVIWRTHTPLIGITDDIGYVISFSNGAYMCNYTACLMYTLHN